MATIPRTTFTITQARTFRITVNGAPAVLPVSGFMPCADENVMIFTPVTDDPIYADETIEDLAALWDAAAPVVERGPDAWQTVVHDHRDSPRLSAPYGYTTAGPWVPVGVAPGARGECDILWRRPLRRAGE